MFPAPRGTSQDPVGEGLETRASWESAPPAGIREAATAYALVEETNRDDATEGLGAGDQLDAPLRATTAMGRDARIDSA